MDLSTFIYGRALQATEFIGRKRALRHLWGRLATGQSTAIIGAPHVGKTSLLNVIDNPEARQSAVGDRFDNHLFHFLDGHMLRDITTQAGFWQQALFPLSSLLLPEKLPNKTKSGTSFGIPTDLYSRLHTEFIQCGLFTTDQELRDIFIEERLSVWQNSLIESNNLTSRVNSVIAFLFRQTHQDENGLVLLLQVLSERFDPADNHYQQFVKLAAELQNEIKGTANKLLDELSQGSKIAYSQHLYRVRDAYLNAEKNQFGGFVLEQLFRALHQANIRLFLLLDEFDDILEHSVLNSAEFYGSLRSLASRSQGLVLVIAARQPLERLNSLTQAINPHGSPYFNVFTEIQLGPLAIKDLASLLDQAKDIFDVDDRRFVEQLSGRHPYLAQLAAAKLWDVHADGFTGNERYRLAAEAVYRETQSHFADTWRVWTNEIRKSITAVALQQLPYLVPDHTFDVGQLTKNLRDFTPELERLEHEGWLEQVDEDRWQVTQHAFLWWLVDELWRNVRDTSDFQSWLQQQEMDGVTTRQQKEVMGQAWGSFKGAMGKGASTFIEAYAKQLAGG